MNDFDPNFLSSIEDVIEDAKKGKMFILVDDEDRENEGDLCILAEFANADSINFMAKHGRGLICLALERTKVENLGLEMMQQRNPSTTIDGFYDTRIPAPVLFARVPGARTGRPAVPATIR